MKKLICVLLCSWTMMGYAQSNNYYKGIVKVVNIFKPVNGSFIAGGYRTEKVNGVNRKVPYRYSFAMSGIKLEYCYPKVATDSTCSYFIIDDQRVDIKGKFESDFACELDISSFNVYQGSFKRHKYVLLTCTNTGSGSSTSSVICNLFDVTNKVQ